MTKPVFIAEFIYITSKTLEDYNASLFLIFIYMIIVFMS